MGELDQKECLCFVDRGTNNFQGHRAILVVAMVVDERMVRFLAKVLGFYHVRVLGFRVATYYISPHFVFMHKSILCLCTEIYKCIDLAIFSEQS